MNKKEVASKISNHMIFEIIELLIFILVAFFDYGLFFLIPISLLFFYHETQLRKLRKEINYDESGKPFRIIGIITVLIGILFLITSPLFLEAIRYLRLLSLPISLIVIGLFVYIVSKFYDKKKK